MGHIAVGCLGVRASNHFGDGTVTYRDTDWPLTAAGGLALLDDGYRRWSDGIRSLDEASMAAPVRAERRAVARATDGPLIFHINREVIHHGAEVALLRDLYVARR